MNFCVKQHEIDKRPEKLSNVLIPLAFKHPKNMIQPDGRNQVHENTKMLGLTHELRSWKTIF